MKLLEHTPETIHVEMALTQLEQMVEQLHEFPDAPCWHKSTQDGVQITICGKFNIGHE
jgi:hypothetical protein